MTQFSSFTFFFLFVFSFLWSFHTNDNDQFRDPRDRHLYPTVAIGDQIWMAKNLAFRTENSSCYDDHPFPCRRYGRLYSWYEALTVCPDGWRLPTNEDWLKLYKRFPNAIDAYEALSIDGSTGFKGQLGGWKHYEENYQHIGERGYFWSATSTDEDNARYYLLNAENKLFNSASTDKDLYFSCRCIKE